jgi:hypothetical protein
MDRETGLRRLITHEDSSPSSTDLEVLRLQLLHFRQKYEDLLVSKRKRIARTLFRIRSSNKRRWKNLESMLLQELVDHVTRSLTARLDDLTDLYLRDLQDNIKMTLLSLFEEEECHFVHKAVKQLSHVASKINPRGSCRILLNGVDYAKIDTDAPPDIPLGHRHDIKQGTAVLFLPFGEILFDWSTPLQNAFGLTEISLRYTHFPEISTFRKKPK